MRLFAATFIWLLHAACAVAQSTNEPVSRCLALAQGAPGITYAAFAQPVATNDEVTIRFAGHSTYVITTPKGVRIATDYAGYLNPPPRVATMNKAHSSHFTDTPEPSIEYVLRGWVPNGGPARHRTIVDDVYIRNVTTNIRAFGGTEFDANSIFIFEVADLCIGHLGHLHHALEDAHYAAIGRLDIVMVPVDGGLTLNHEEMTRIVRRLSSSIVLPMHRRGTPIERFLSMTGNQFSLDTRPGDSFTISARILPRTPTIIILDNL